MEHKVSPVQKDIKATKENKVLLEIKELKVSLDLQAFKDSRELLVIKENKVLLEIKELKDLLVSGIYQDVDIKVLLDSRIYWISGISRQIWNFGGATFEYIANLSSTTEEDPGSQNLD